ncbi:ABC transporter ATP-binding protein [uncultured Ruminococcus sp.]|uniref:ABC transporter ATP-binding protein n=1 Tax=uncultured Ruminococcus sp. TaxID=165186 RepID=UPI0025F1A3F3|nr:ABC transporter ATP-binding protein [uncultured Ruminococcus sp.]
MDYVIETRELTKRYGQHAAADAVSLHVKRGEIYGFIGRNGAGKTTCMKMICGLTTPTSGSIRLFGKSEQESGPLRSRIGSLIEEPGLYYEMTAYENLKCRCLMTGIDEKGHIDSLLELVGLSYARNRKAKAFSLGMRQRLGIALALTSNPEILVLDEPINGLDPQGIAEMRQLFVRLKEEKQLAIMISSHILEELSKLADTFGIIHDGRLLQEISREQLMENCSSYAEIITTQPEQITGSLEKMGYTRFQIVDGETVRVFERLDETAAMNRQLILDGCTVAQSRIVTAELEDYFFKITGGNQNA